MKKTIATILTMISTGNEAKDAPLFCFKTSWPAPAAEHHVVERFAWETGKRTMVVGHRGGMPADQAPENSLKSFAGAIENNFEGIEFDVWLSKDNVPMVLHGGQDAELDHYGFDGEYAYDWTQEELQTRIDIGEGERIPTLESVIKLCENSPNMLLNIEVKSPESEEQFAKYDVNLAAKNVVNLIEKYNIGLKVMISSFGPHMVYSIIYNSKPNRKFIIQTIPWEGGKCIWDQFNAHDQITGSNFSTDELNQQKVQEEKNKGNFVGAWYDSSYIEEGHELWDQVFMRDGVDFFYSDKTVEAMKARDNVQTILIS